jgi:hypothetical protein
VEKDARPVQFPGRLRPFTDSAAAQSNGAVPGATRTYATISSIGIEWDLAGDADHDATTTVQFRPAGTSAWRPALPLVRVDYNGVNMLAGSIHFLDPNVAHEIRLTFADPDGGAAVQTVIVPTRLGRRTRSECRR